MKSFNVEGSWPGIVTPFTEHDNVNVDSLKRVIEFHIENRSDGLLILGSTGEAIMLSRDERRKVIDAAVDFVNGRIPVMCGISAVTTKETLENARYAKNAGVDCSLLVQPAYIQPTQDALYKYYKEVAEEANFPMVIYHDPTRTGVSIKAETIAKLSNIDNIVALKEAGPILIKSSG